MMKRETLHLPTFKWERKSTTGNPPAGVRGFAYTNIANNILYFGGCCKPERCFHNDLFDLNTVTHSWRKLTSSNLDNEPMPKESCGMITFNIYGKVNLLVFGGHGPIPVTTEAYSQYFPTSPASPHCYTNEIHTLDLSSLPGIT